MTTRTAFQTLELQQTASVCCIALNKPPLNIIDFQMIQEIRAVLRELQKDSSVRVIVFRGAGPKGFSAGVSVQDHSPDRVAEVIPAFDDIFRLMARTDQVTVAAVHGFCLGGGFEVVQMCDLVIAAEKTQFGQPEIKLGQAAPIGLILLPHLIGYRRAVDLLFTGRTFDASEAAALGLVNRVVPAEQLNQSVDDLVKDLSAQSGAILRLSKQALRRTAGLDFEKLLEDTERFFLKSVVATHDAKEGIAAFLAKRAPNWIHA